MIGAAPRSAASGSGCAPLTAAPAARSSWWRFPGLRHPEVHEGVALRGSGNRLSPGRPGRCPSRSQRRPRSARRARAALGEFPPGFGLPAQHQQAGVLDPLRAQQCSHQAVGDVPAQRQLRRRFLHIGQSGDVGQGSLLGQGAHRFHTGLPAVDHHRLVAGVPWGRPHPHRDFGDHPERAFAPDGQLARSGPAAGPGRRQPPLAGGVACRPTPCRRSGRSRWRPGRTNGSRRNRRWWPVQDCEVTEVTVPGEQPFRVDRPHPGLQHRDPRHRVSETAVSRHRSGRSPRSCPAQRLHPADHGRAAAERAPPRCRGGRGVGTRCTCSGLPGSTTASGRDVLPVRRRSGSGRPFRQAAEPFRGAVSELLPTASTRSVCAVAGSALLGALSETGTVGVTVGQADAVGQPADRVPGQPGRGTGRRPAAAQRVLNLAAHQYSVT